MCIGQHWSSESRYCQPSKERLNTHHQTQVIGHGKYSYFVWIHIFKPWKQTSSSQTCFMITQAQAPLQLQTNCADYAAPTGSGEQSNQMMDPSPYLSLRASRSDSMRLNISPAQNIRNYPWASAFSFYLLNPINMSTQLPTSISICGGYACIMHLSIRKR